jgi:hypothetical protein
MSVRQHSMPFWHEWTQARISAIMASSKGTLMDKMAAAQCKGALVSHLNHFSAKGYDMEEILGMDLAKY